MNETEKKIIDTFTGTLPKMTDAEKDKLLSFGEGMAFIVNRDAKSENKGENQ